MKSASRTLQTMAAAGTIGLAAGGASAALPNGLATGDVTQTSAVLWARSDSPGQVTFAYSTDPNFATGVLSTNVNVADPNVPAKLPVSGLTPGTTYHVRAIDGTETVTGRFATPAASGVQEGLTIAVLSDWQQAPPFPTVANVPDRNPDLVLKLGDTIYADLETPALPGVSQARTLDQFRIKHAEVLSARPGGATTGPFSNHMKNVYAAAPVLSTIDDHEIVDNFAGGAAPGDSPDAPDIGSSNERLFTDGSGSVIGNPVPPGAQFVNETTVYQDAIQAYEEYHPQTPQVWTGTGDPRMEGKPKLYRHVQYGSDASVTMLDSRSFRDAQLAPPTNPTDPTQVTNFFTAALDPTRTLLGRSQVDQLKTDLLAAQAAGTTWKFVTIPEPIQEFGIVNAEDRFEGYAAERNEILGFVDQAGIENVVFLAGDFHGNVVNDLSYQLPDGLGGLETVRTNAFEIVTGPVSFFDGRFGPNVANIAAATGLISPEQLAFYDALPVAEDGDDAVNDKDDFIKSLVNQQVGLTSLGGPNPLGLADATRIDATLLEGDYLSSHRFAWTELDIDPLTQELLVTIWGIEAFSEQDVLDAITADDLSAIEDLTPQIVSQFSVRAVPEPTTLALLVSGGLAVLRRRRTAGRRATPYGGQLLTLGAFGCGSSFSGALSCPIRVELADKVCWARARGNERRAIYPGLEGLKTVMTSVKS